MALRKSNPNEKALGLLLVAPHPPGGMVGCLHDGIKTAFVAVLFEQPRRCPSDACAVAGVGFWWEIFTSSLRSATCYFSAFILKEARPVARSVETLQIHHWPQTGSSSYMKYLQRGQAWPAAGVTRVL